MTLHSMGVAAMPALVAVVLAGSAQTASAAGTVLHDYRLNEFTGDVDDFGNSSPALIDATDPDGIGPLSGAGANGVGAVGPVPAVGVARVAGCTTARLESITLLCRGYAFGFSQGVALDGRTNPGGGDAANAIVIEMLISDGRGRRKGHDF